MKQIKRNKEHNLRRGAAFVLGMGTKVIPDKKKKQNKEFCRD